MRALAGFMDAGQFGGFAAESLEFLEDHERAALEVQVDAARLVAQSLPPVVNFGVELSPLDPALTAALVGEVRFQEIFPNPTAYRFAWIDPTNLIAVQAFVNEQQEAVPTDDQGLVAFSLPTDWRVPVETTLIPPAGPIYVVTSSPHLAGLQIHRDPASGDIVIRPPAHANLVQVVQFAGRYFLRNGYHRVAGAINQGLTRLPAMVFDASQPPEVELQALGAAAFNAMYLLSLPRPPLVADFSDATAVTIKMREKRYGLTLSLQISPLNIGV